MKTFIRWLPLLKFISFVSGTRVPLSEFPEEYMRFIRRLTMPGSH